MAIIKIFCSKYKGGGNLNIKAGMDNNSQLSSISDINNNINNFISFIERLLTH